MNSDSPILPAPRPPLFDRLRQTGHAAELTAMTLARVKVRKQRKKMVRRAVLGVFLVAGLLTWAIPYRRSTETISTGVARRQALVLLDGSQAQLNANTELFSDFRYGRRVIALHKGEAFFSVTKDTNHPFLVKTPSGTVRVTGTKFNVRLSGDNRAEVTLVEGGIAFEVPKKAATALHPGDQLDTGTASIRTLTPDEIAGVSAWLEGRIALKDLPLAEVLQRLGAYHGRSITCARDLADIRLGGTFPLDDLPAFIRAAESGLKVRFVDRGNGAYYVESR